MHQGHYTTLVAEKKLSSSDGTPSSWVLADDDIITQDVAHERACKLMQRYAYIVVYQATSGGGGGGGEGGREVSKKSTSKDINSEQQKQQPEKEEETSAQL